MRRLCKAAPDGQLADSPEATEVSRTRWAIVATLMHMLIQAGTTMSAGLRAQAFIDRMIEVDVAVEAELALLARHYTGLLEIKVWRAAIQEMEQISASILRAHPPPPSVAPHCPVCWLRACHQL